MSKSEMKKAIEQHVPSVNGTVYQLRFQWSAVEPRWLARGTRYLLAIEVLPNSAASTGQILHVVTRATTTRDQLLALVDDALDEYLGRPSVAVPALAAGGNQRSISG